MRRPELSNVEVVAPDEEEEAVGGGDFLFSKTVRKASRAHPASYSMRAEVVCVG